MLPPPARELSSTYGAGASAYGEDALKSWKAQWDEAARLAKERQWPAVVELLERCSTERPDFAKGYVPLSRALRQLNQLDGAVAVLRRGLENCAASGSAAPILGELLRFDHGLRRVATVPVPTPHVDGHAVDRVRTEVRILLGRHVVGDRHRHPLRDRAGARRGQQRRGRGVGRALAVGIDVVARASRLDTDVVGVDVHGAGAQRAVVRHRVEAHARRLGQRARRVLAPEVGHVPDVARSRAGGVNVDIDPTEELRLGQRAVGCSQSGGQERRGNHVQGGLDMCE
jgi:hypothetical protein